jgi:hypothetical protein
MKIALKEYMGWHSQDMPSDAKWASSTASQRLSADGERIKFPLTVSEEVRLLCTSRRRILLSVRSINGYAHMNSTNLIARVAQGLLAVTATGVSVLILQFAMVA